MKLSDIIGMTGVIMMLAAYLLNLAKIRSQDSLFYILMNLIGGALSTTAAVMIVYMPFILLEGVWTAASLVAFVNYLRVSRPTA
ncbi:MAG: hypothetical protein JST83_02880 [Bacteroidetes bacterium]|nr:hypothetical protein [Bacteroidota bacterium]